MTHWIRPVAPVVAAALVNACGGGGSSGTPGAPVSDGKIDRPTAINLYPSQSPAEGSRLIVRVTGVGSAQVNMPVVFDTGSAGLTLYAPDIFPASMVSPQGFVFPAGQSSLTYNGITVTNSQGAGTITVSGSIEPSGGYPVCAPDTTGTCLAVSVLKYLPYSSTVNAGFMLTPATLQSCDITMPGNCSPEMSWPMGQPGYLPGCVG